MIRLVYNLLFPIGLLLFMPGYLLKMRRRGNYRRNFGQRFGFYSAEMQERLAQRPVTWIHAVSVGEVAIALKLAAKLRQLDATLEFVLTTTTTTGYAVAERAAAEWMQVMYNPLDFLPIVRRAFTAIRPTRILLVEAEVWPNLAAEARRRRIPVALVNARLSPRSERRFQRFRMFVAPTFRCLDLVCVPERRDVSRWEQLGVTRDRIRLVGSIKYDPLETPPASVNLLEILSGFGISVDSPVLFGGSTHRGEEEILAETFLRLRPDFPSLKLMIAPRHAERAADIRLTLERMEIRVAQRSASSGSGSVDCLLLDSTGELRSWYSVATVVFVGKSLTVTGGQNPVEPILAGKPVIFGPHMENFAVLAEALVVGGGALQVAGREALPNAVAQLLGDPVMRERLVKNAHGVLATHRGATQRTAELIASL
ncbi:MAG: 3-deoxy-D-manno-octulosonic acid transferase, partial [Chthoniobacterales bacterium]|nr:3-deoxy-D-manno-octulosonic acid transferase [Chthoniobacterales bacterium]